MSCELVSVVPSVGSLLGQTQINIRVASSDTSLNGNFSIYINKSLLVTPYTISTNKDGTLLLTTLSPPGLKESTVRVTVSPCFGSSSFNYYDSNSFNITMPTTTIGSLGGTSIELNIVSSDTTAHIWFKRTPFIYMKLSTPLNNRSIVYSLQRDYTISAYNRFYHSATDEVSILGINISATVSVSFNNDDYIPITSTVYIVEKSPIRVLFMYNSIVDDHGWSYAHNNAKILVANYFSVALQIDFDECLHIYNGGFIEARASSKKYDVIFVCTDFGHDYFVSITQQYPEVTFVLVSNDALKDRPAYTNNLVYTTCLLNEGIYLSGVVAGNMIPPGGLVCFIKGFDVSSVQQGLNAFGLGLFKYNPTAQLKTVTINSWTDFFQEKQAAQWFYAHGCDLLTHQTSHADTLQVFTSQGRYGVGVYGESKSLLGENLLTSGVFNWTPGHQQLLQYALDGKLHNLSLVKGYADSAEYASPLSGRVPYSVRVIYQEEKSKLTSVFCGPIYDNSSSTVPRIAAGHCASNQELYDMNWTLRGITELGNYRPIVSHFRHYLLYSYPHDCIQPPVFNDNRLEATLVVAYIAVVGILYVIAALFAIFVYYKAADEKTKTNNSVKLVTFAQPPFLYVILLGCCVGLSAVIPLSIDVSITDADAYSIGTAIETTTYPMASRACNAVPWLLVIGYELVVPVLSAKSHVQHVWLELISRSMKRNVYSLQLSVIPYLLGSLLTSFVPLLVWNIRDPLHWHTEIQSINEYDMPISSIGQCKGSHSINYIICIGIILAMSLAHAYAIAYETRHDEDVNRESDKIFLSIGNILQTTIIASLLLILLSSNPQARFIVFATAVIVIFGGTMLIVFTPKVYAAVFSPKRTQVKITIEDNRIVPSGLQTKIDRHSLLKMPIIPVGEYFSRGLFPSVAVGRLLQGSVFPHNEYAPDMVEDSYYKEPLGIIEEKSVEKPIVNMIERKPAIRLVVRSCNL